MIQHPAVISLIVSSLIISAMLLVSGGYGCQILRKWDLESGSELQLKLERRTYLISTLLGYALFFQVLSLFFYIYTADSIHKLFSGAMCAAGSLSANGYGYPVLLLKIVNCLLSGLWLILNHLDNRGYDYPLIRKKYGFLLLLALLISLEALLQLGYFRGLRIDVITSCCGSLFSAGRGNIASDIAAFPATPMIWLFSCALVACLASGITFLVRGWGSRLFAILSMLFFVIAIASLLSFISLYFYELPTHHCPFCILQWEYGHVGYLLYLFLMVGGISGGGAGMIAPFRGVASLAGIITKLQRKLVVVALLSYGGFAMIVFWRIMTTPFRL